MKCLLFFLLLCTCGPARTLAQDPVAILDRVIEAIGGHAALYELRDVSYTYHYGPRASTERYIFDGEVSYGRSTMENGQVREQLFDGSAYYTWIDGKVTNDEKQLRSTTFTRSTNYYWLLMMHKLRDPGLLYTYGGQRTYEGIDYELVDVTFRDGVGMAKDRYLLYVNPHTHLVDQFLFTVAAAGRMTPIMMKHTYDTFAGGVKFPVVSRSRAALNWEGDLDPEQEWSARWRSDFRFNNGFTVGNIRQE